MATETEMVAAIRSDRFVGRGTCTSIDECIDDAELGSIMRDEGITTRANAIMWCRRDEGIRREYAEDIVAAGR